MRSGRAVQNLCAVYGMLVDSSEPLNTPGYKSRVLSADFSQFIRNLFHDIFRLPISVRINLIPTIHTTNKYKNELHEYI